MPLVAGQPNAAGSAHRRLLADAGIRNAIPRPQPLAGSEFATIRLRLLKIAVRISETASRVRLGFAANCPDAALFRGLIGTLILCPT